MQSCKKPFEPQSDVRNLDYLIIGDICNPKDYVAEGKTYHQIAATGRGYRSAYELLRHTHSILGGMRHGDGSVFEG